MTTLAAPAEPVPPVPRWRGLRPGLRERLYQPMPTDRLTGWLWPLLVTVLAGYLRFRRLDQPKSLVFDEVYYAHDAKSLLEHGVERGPNFTDPAFVVHPPLGKWMIAVGEWLFGGGDQTINGAIYPSNPYGWRFSAALVGTLSVLILARTVRRMMRSTLLGCVAGLLLTLDGLAFVQSRIATLDIFLMFWILAGFACLVADRDWGRRRLADRLERAGTPFIPGPEIGFRPWRILAMACMGAAIATKWAGLFYAVVLIALAFSWDVGARRASGDPSRYRPVRLWQWLRRQLGLGPRPIKGVSFWHWVRQAFRYDALPLVAAALLIPVLYTASWGGWFATSGGYDRHWAQQNQSEWHLGPLDLPGIGSHMPAAVRSWVHYHHDMYQFHDRLNPRDSKDAHHPYQSHPWGWLALARPVSYFYSSPKQGESGCTASGCSREVLGIGTPAIWWATFPALALMVGAWVGRRDWRGGLAILGILTAIVPWIYYDYGGRTMFLFYALPAVPFMAMALAYCIGWAIGPPDGSSLRRTFGSAGAGAYLILVLANFVYLYPVLAAQTISYSRWRDIMWFTSWI